MGAYIWGGIDIIGQTNIHLAPKKQRIREVRFLVPNLAAQSKSMQLLPTRLMFFC